MDEQESGFESLSDADLDRIDLVCDRFQESLQSGPPPRIEEFVSDASADARSELIRELVDMEVHFRKQRGESPTAEEYLGRFPECADGLSELLVNRPSAGPSADTRAMGLDATPPSGPLLITPSVPLGPGARLGAYEVVDVLGQGGMGTVYKARHTKLGRTVALKVLLPGLLNRPDAVARFEAEIRALGPIDHRNVVHAIDADESDGYHYYAMDFVPGIDLSRLSKQLGSLPAADACELIRQAAEGLEYLSQKGIVHRDIKPANLMVCAGLEVHGMAECTRQTMCCDWAPLVKILDMGLARGRQGQDEDEPITSSGQLLGTVDFMAPEQLGDSHEVDVRSDIYSLGATLHQLLTGRPPYPSSSQLGKLRALATESPPAVAELRPDLPAPLAAAVDRMLQRDPAARFETPSQVAEVLAPFTEGTDLRELVRRAVAKSDDVPALRTSAAAPGSMIPTEDVQVRSGSASAAEATPRGSRTTAPAAVRWRVVAAAIGLMCVIGAVVAVMFRVSTPYGEVVVRAAEGTDIEVDVQQNGKTVDVIGPKNGWRVRVAEGGYDLVLRTTDRELTLDNDTATVSRDGTAEVTIVRRSTKAAQLAKTSPPTPLEFRPSEVGRLENGGQRLGDGDSRTVQLGDFDGDGDLDAFVVNHDEEANRVWVNDGAGVFTDSGQRLGAAYSWDLALGDLDGDGDLDAFVVNNKGQASRIWVNDGQGDFSDSGQEIFNVDAHGAALADLDGDGDLDVMIADHGANNVWQNDGNGQFRDTGQRLGTGDSWCVALADLNGDGAVDAFVGNLGYDNGEPNRVWLNDGKGVFQESGQPLGDASTIGVALADVDGDGDTDAFAANHGNQRNRIWLNDGKGRFAGIDHQGFLKSVHVSLGDLNGDGSIDALIANDENKPNEIAYNGGLAIYSRKNVQWAGMSSSGGTALGDLDGDGDLDAFVTNRGGHPNGVWFYRQESDTPVMDERLLRDSGQRLGSNNGQHVILTDLDNDDDLDAFIGNYKHPDCVWLNEGGGIFRDSGQHLGESRSVRVALGDLDGDGDLDAFVPNVGNQPNNVLFNVGDGVFRDSGQSLGNSGSKAAVLRDFDSDGDLDAIVINYYRGQPNRVWLNDGAGNFTDSGQTLGRSASEGLAIGDLDGDGDQDAFVANLSNQPNLVYWNDGTGTFTESGQQLGRSHSKGVSLGDFDGDGDLDAFVSNDGPNRAWINDGNGFFKDSGQRLGNLWSSYAALGDMDGDGDIDACVANGGPNVIWLNDGNAVFEVGQLLDGSYSSIGMALADLDGDRDLDAFVANHNVQPNHVWLNQGAGESTDQSAIEAAAVTGPPAQAPTAADDGDHDAVDTVDADVTPADNSEE